MVATQWEEAGAALIKSECFWAGLLPRHRLKEGNQLVPRTEPSSPTVCSRPPPCAVRMSMFIYKVSLLPSFPQSYPGAGWGEGALPDSKQRRMFCPWLWVHLGQSPCPHLGPVRSPFSLPRGFRHIRTMWRVCSQHGHTRLLTGHRHWRVSKG